MYMHMQNHYYFIPNSDNQKINVHYLLFKDIQIYNIISEYPQPQPWQKFSSVDEYDLELSKKKNLDVTEKP